MPGIGGEFSCLSRLCFFVVPRVSFCPICFSCQTVRLQPQGIPVKNASGADEARLLREAGAAYLRRSRPTDDPQGAYRHGQQSRLLRPRKVCRPAYGVLAGRYFQTQYARTASHAFRFSAALPAPAPRRRGACCGVPASRAETAARPVLARIHRSRLFSTDLTRRFCVSPFLL